MKKQDYFDSNLDNAMELLAASGYENDDIFAEGEGNGDDIFAGGVVKQANQTPFSITLTNTTGADISNVSFLDAINGIMNGASNYGVTAGISVSYDTAGVSYAQFLWAANNDPILVNQILVESTTVAQLGESLKIETQNVRGKGAYETFYPKRNPQQNLTDMLVVDYGFFINGFTKITINKIRTLAAVTYNFYPEAVANSLGALTGKGANTYKKQPLIGMQLMK